MKTIIAIGGGSKAGTFDKGTLSIDKEIIRLSGKKRPKVLFVPTAKSDAQDYINAFHKYYEGFLKCSVDSLLLLGKEPSMTELKKKIFSADIIYVGGGNTLKMMRRWRHLGVDKLLRFAWQDGVVLCGVSAGSMCWFDSGHSDSMSFYNSKKWKYINVKGLGLIEGIHCPHYNSKTLGVARRENFQNMIKKIGGFGIAIDNNCAIEFIDGRYYKVITSKQGVGAYKVYKKGGKIISEKIEQKKELTPVSELYKDKYQ